LETEGLLPGAQRAIPTAVQAEVTLLLEALQR
jgi:hypothetical protein